METRLMKRALHGSSHTVQLASRRILTTPDSSTNKTSRDACDDFTVCLRHSELTCTFWGLDLQQINFPGHVLAGRRFQLDDSVPLHCAEGEAWHDRFCLWACIFPATDPPGCKAQIDIKLPQTPIRHRPAQELTIRHIGGHDCSRWRDRVITMPDWQEKAFKPYFFLTPAMQSMQQIPRAKLEIALFPSCMPGRSPWSPHGAQVWIL